jgi:hypothetical protein
VRPVYGPVPGSLSLLLDGQPDAVTLAAAREIEAAGLKVRWSEPAEGYLETEWYDLGSSRSVDARARNLDRVVKLRFFADPTAGTTRLAAECVTRIAYDPSVPARDLERMVPDSTPGRELLDRIVARLKAAFPTATPSGTQRPTGN